MMAASIDARLACSVVMRLAVPLRVEALAETTPGNAVSALAMRRSQAVQVIPATERVMSSFGRRLAASALAPLVTVMEPSSPYVARVDVIARTAPTPPG